MGWLLYALLMAVRVPHILLGLIAIPIGLRFKTTPRILQGWGNAADVPSWWMLRDIYHLRYAYLGGMWALVIYSARHWHEFFVSFTLLAALASLLVLDEKRWSQFWWMAIRNPGGVWKGRFRQPAPAQMPDPDYRVRVEGLPFASRYTRYGWYVEYWSLRRINWFGKVRYWEVRIGWRFGDTTENFTPTFQLGPKR